MAEFDIEKIVSEMREKKEEVWFSGEFENRGDKVLLRPTGQADMPILYQFDAADVTRKEDGPDAEKGIGVKVGSVYVIQLVSIAGRSSSQPSLQPAFRGPGQYMDEASQKSHGHAVMHHSEASQKSHGHCVVELGDWVLSQKSHGHYIMGNSEISQKSHGHSIMTTADISQKSHGHCAVELGDWVLSKKPRE